jgi:hypothetical protein
MLELWKTALGEDVPDTVAGSGGAEARVPTMVRSLAPGGATGLGAKIAVVPPEAVHGQRHRLENPRTGRRSAKWASSGAQTAADHGSERAESRRSAAAVQNVRVVVPACGVASSDHWTARPARS